MPQLQWQLLLWKQNISPQSVFSFFLLFGHLEHLNVRKDECKKLWGTASCPCWKDSFSCGRGQAVIDGAQLSLESPDGTARPSSEQAQCHPSIWTRGRPAKRPCRRIKCVCWGQESQSETSKQLSILRFTCLWLRGCDTANPDFG